MLKDHHSNQQWRSAAAAVFVQARSLEQELCSDVQLHHALWVCLEQLQQDAAQDATHATPLTAAVSSSSSSGSLVVLARSLLRHMELESLTPATLTRPRRAASTDAAVLTLQEQQAILSGLLTEQKVLASRLQALLFDPTAAPVVQLDAESKAVLLAPLQAYSTAAAPQAAAVAPPAAPAAAAGGAAACAVDDELTEVQLDMQLVSAVLQQHPDPAVRAEVYAAGLLQRLDALLSAWGDLAEVRLKIGRWVHSGTRAQPLMSPAYACSAGIHPAAAGLSR